MVKVVASTDARSRRAIDHQILWSRHARTYKQLLLAMASLLRRPFDLFIVVTLFFFLLVAITIGKKKSLIHLCDKCIAIRGTSLGTGGSCIKLDFLSLSLSLPTPSLSVSDFTQSVYGSILALEDIDEWVWPPSQLLQAYAWWCETYDPLLAHNPMWYVPKC